MRSVLVNGSILLASFAFALGLTEAALRLAAPDVAKLHYVWPPNSQFTFHPDPKTLKGVTGDSHVSVNSHGIRASEFSHKQKFRVLAIGGSTTESLYLDQSESWAGLVETKLNKISPGGLVWVGNAGQAGRHTRDHVMQVKHLLPELPKIDVALFLIGVNDMNLRLTQGTKYDPRFLDSPGAEQHQMKRAFDIYPGQESSLPWYRRTELFKLANRVRWRLFGSKAFWDGQDAQGHIHDQWRAERKRAVAIRSKLPDLTSGLEEYERNVNRIIDMLRARGVRPVFLTQPTHWRPGLPKQVIETFWVGKAGDPRPDGGQVYYSVEALAKAMEAYNQGLLKVCTKRQADCLDMAAALPKEPSIFWDDDHYTEKGAEQFATVLAGFLSKFLPAGPGPDQATVVHARP